MKAMILAAGLGTRLKPFTDNHPKALAIVNGKTLLQRNIEYLGGFGIKDVIVNIHHFPEQIKELVEKNKGFGSNISFSDESNEVLETGGGLKKAAWFFEGEKEPFVLMNVDILTSLNLHEMIACHNNEKPLATLAVSVRFTSRYFLFDERDYLSGWKNTKTGEQIMVRQAEKLTEKAFSGIHVISPKIFSLIKLKGKFSLVDLYLGLAKSNIIFAYTHSNSKFIDVGKPESILKAEKLFK
ncbi:MAG: sugar phosphate nucleotidyltransferase [Ginsengibacter sp.]